jgi:hypothetical protein
MARQRSLARYFAVAVETGRRPPFKTIETGSYSAASLKEASFAPKSQNSFSGKEFVYATYPEDPDIPL